MRGSQRAAAGALLLALLPTALEWLLAREFAVHTSGGVLITGASTGIGHHAAVALARQGYHVYAGVRKEADAATISGAGIATLHPVTIDVADSASIAAAVASVGEALEALGLPLIAVVNNAGISKDLPVEVQSLSSARQVFDVNYFGAVDVTQQFLPLLRAAGGGARIVTTGSLAGWISMPGTATYSGTKHALEAFSDALRMELQPHDISVSLIKPGYVVTEIGAKALAGSDPEALARSNPAGHALYKDFLELEAIRVKHVFELAPGPEVTTEVITHAITSRHPKTRYFVGAAGVLPGWVAARIKWLLPDRLWDLMIAYEEIITRSLA